MYWPQALHFCRSLNLTILNSGSYYDDFDLHHLESVNPNMPHQYTPRTYKRTPRKPDYAITHYYSIQGSFIDDYAVHDPNLPTVYDLIQHLYQHWPTPTKSFDYVDQYWETWSP